MTTQRASSRASFCVQYEVYVVNIYKLYSGQNKQPVSLRLCFDSFLRHFYFIAISSRVHLLFLIIAS